MMKESHRLGLLSSVVKMLDEAGSWTGRTHIHKFVYFAQELLGIPSGYEFVLYQRGPYSFELDADIRSLRSMGALDITPAPPYGPSYGTTPLGTALMRLSRLDDETDRKLAELAKAFGPKQATELELLGTTLYVINEGYESDEDIVERVLSLKPHFEEDVAKDALREVKEMREHFKLPSGT